MNIAGTEKSQEPNDNQINANNIVQQSGTIRMRIPAISDISGARLKVMFMAESFLAKSSV